MGEAAPIVVANMLESTSLHGSSPKHALVESKSHVDVMHLFNRDAVVRGTFSISFSICGSLLNQVTGRISDRSRPPIYGMATRELFRTGARGDLN